MGRWTQTFNLWNSSHSFKMTGKETDQSSEEGPISLARYFPKAMLKPLVM